MCAYANPEENISFEIVPAIIPKAPWRIASVSHLPGFRLSVRFNDGTEGTVAMYGLIHSLNAGVFEALRDVNFFKKVSLQYGAVTWPGDLDLAPDAMYEEIRRTGECVLGG
jgi:hypothetical protein